MRNHKALRAAEQVDEEVDCFVHLSHVCGSKKLLGPLGKFYLEAVSR